MSQLMTSPPYTPVEAVTEVLHGVAVTDPYRWLEDQESQRTREWLSAQQQYARSCLDRIPGRERIRERIRELLDVETCDSMQKVGSRYFFRKRSRGKQQPCIFFREGPKGSDQLLIDPEARGTGVYTAVKPVCASNQGRLLLYEVKEGGERTGRFEILDVNRREALPDSLPRGYLRGFIFAPDGTSFYYAHEPVAPEMRSRNAVYHHVLGTPFDEDQQIFSAGDRQNIRLVIVPGKDRLGFLVFQFLDETFTDFYLWPLHSGSAPDSIIRSAHYRFSPRILDDGRILALTDREAPNARIVEVRPRPGREPEFVDVVPAEGAMIQSWIVAGERILVSYIRDLKTEIAILDLSGRRLGQLPVEDSDTVRLLGASDDGEEVFLEQEAFTKPLQTLVCSPESIQAGLWAARTVPFAAEDFDHKRIWFTAKDGTRVPMFLVGRRELFAGGCHPAIMTSYGGYGVPMTPQFSVFVAFLMERGCLFALPNIRGGSEFGAAWHDSAKRRNRQVAFDDFLSAAEWLIESGHTKPEKLAIFGGSNSGLLVGAAMTQRPDLFHAVICMVPMLDMLRYHLFDHAHIWKSEFGTADHADDFAALYRYSPYHKIRNGTSYPATMFVSGDSDQNCNSLHARKMTARLQAANTSDFPIFLDYSPQRGHSPVLPLSTRIEALTDRMAFLCNQLGLTM
jgi:prolyl oligopeptidase